MTQKRNDCFVVDVCFLGIRGLRKRWVVCCINRELEELDSEKTGNVKCELANYSDYVLEASLSTSLQGSCVFFRTRAQGEPT